MDEIKKGISEASSCTEAFRLLLQTQEPQSLLRVLNPDRSLCGLIWVKDGKTITAASRVTGSTGYMALLELLALKQSHFQLAVSDDLADGEMLQLALTEAIEDETRFIDKIKAIIWPVEETQAETIEPTEPESDKEPPSILVLANFSPLQAEPEPELEPEPSPLSLVAAGESPLPPEPDAPPPPDPASSSEHLKARDLKDKLNTGKADELPVASQTPAAPTTRITDRIPRHILLPLGIAVAALPILATFLISTAGSEKRAAADDAATSAAAVERIMDEQSPTREPQHSLRTAK